MDVNDLPEADVKAAVLKMVAGKAAGPDKITVEMIKASREAHTSPAHSLKRKENPKRTDKVHTIQTKR